MLTITGKENTANFRLLTLRRALKLEAKTGMKLSRGRSAYSIVKAEFGFKGNKQKVYEQFDKYVESKLGL